MFVKDGMNEVEIKKYEAIIEAILFTMGEAVEVDKIAYAIGHDVETTKKLIANLVKDGNYGMPYLPEKIYADMRRLSMFRDQLTEDRIRNINRLHREMKIYFPEYADAFGKKF